MFISPRHLVLAALLAASPVAAGAQAAAPVRVSAGGAELRAAPDGGRVATLSRGAALVAGGARGAWREVTLEGWVPARSVAPAGSGGRVAVQGSATLRAAPEGAVVATADAGMVLREVERRGTWVRVRRTGWIRANGLGAPPAADRADDRPASTPTSAAAPKPAASRTARDTAARPRPAASAGTAAPTPARPLQATRPAAASRPANEPPATRPASPAASSARPAAATPAASPVKPAAAPASPAAARTAPAAAPAVAAPRRDAVVLHSAPGAGQVAVVEPGAAVQVLARQGEWTRVRVEGWTRSPVAGTPAGAVAGRPATLAALRADPDAFVGRDVDWTLRFVAVQVADSVRSDFRPGEPFVLARDPNGETGFVYVAVTPQQAAAMRRFTPLQPFRMTGRIRVPRSPLMGHPIVDLVRLR